MVHQLHNAKCYLARHIQGRLSSRTTCKSSLQHTRPRHTLTAHRYHTTTARPQVQTHHAAQYDSTHPPSTILRRSTIYHLPLQAAPHSPLNQTTRTSRSHSYSSRHARHRLHIQPSCSNRIARRFCSTYLGILWLWTSTRRPRLNGCERTT